MTSSLDSSLEAWIELKLALTEQVKSVSVELPSDYECKECNGIFFILRKENGDGKPATVSLVYDAAANLLKVGCSWRSDDPEMIQLHQPDVSALKDQSISNILAAPK